MSYFRRCSRTACGRPAVATLTYVYADSTAVVGPLATHVEPHSYDLCEEHALRLSAPRGWELVRHEGEFAPAPPNPDDMEALADAVRDAGTRERARDAARSAEAEAAVAPQPRRRGGAGGASGAASEAAGRSGVATADRPRSPRHLKSVPQARAE